MRMQRCGCTVLRLSHSTPEGKSKTKLGETDYSRFAEIWQEVPFHRWDPSELHSLFTPSGKKCTRRDPPFQWKHDWTAFLPVTQHVCTQS